MWGKQKKPCPCEEHSKTLERRLDAQDERRKDDLLAIEDAVDRMNRIMRRMNARSRWDPPADTEPEQAPVSVGFDRLAAMRTLRTKKNGG